MQLVCTWLSTAFILLTVLLQSTTRIVRYDHHVVEAFTIDIPSSSHSKRFQGRISRLDYKRSVTPSLSKLQYVSSKISLSSSSLSSTSVNTINEIKARLLRVCGKTPKSLPSDVKTIIDELESVGADLGIGQSSSLSGLMSGEWELIYASTDITRSSPFFWAFRKAFPDTADQIYDITDMIPSPVKDVGPAYQQIELSGTGTGRFVSRVKVATLSGLATSIMTTRGTVTGYDNTDGLKIKIDTTKPEKSTALSTLFGPIGEVINENLPPFPSGDALERIVPGSSEIILRTTFCDEGIRISRNDERLDDEFFVWIRKEFASYEFL